MLTGKSRTQKTIINTAAGVINRFCTIILNFLLRTVFIYTLGVQYVGVSSVFSDILTILSVSELGISTAIATALYSPLKTEDKDHIRRLMSFYRKAYRYIAVAVAVIGIMMLPALKWFIKDVPDIKEDIRVIFSLYIVKTAISYLLIYKATILVADQKQYIVKGLETICTVVRYIAEGVILLVCQNYMLYLVVEVAATLLQNYAVTSEAQKQYPYAFTGGAKLSKEERNSLLRNIKGLATFQISAAVGNSIDNLLVSGFISTTVVGVLSNYTMIRKQAEELIKQFFAAVTPSIGSLAVEKDPKKQTEVFKRLFYISFVIANFCGASLYVLLNPFIKLWLGEDFLLENNIVFILVFDFFLYILLQAVASFRTANGLFVKGQYRPLVTAVLNVILSVFLIKKYGIWGTIFATVLCRLLTQWYDPYILYRNVFKESFTKFYVQYWKYIFLFLSGCLLTDRTAAMICMKNDYLNAGYRLLCCLIIPNLWVILFTFWTSECKFFIKLFRRGK